MNLIPPFLTYSLCPSETVAHPPYSTPTIDELDKSISNYQNMLSSLPWCSHWHAALLATLAMKLYCHSLLSGDKQDLEMSFPWYIHAIFLSFHPSTKGGPNHISVFYFLACTLTSTYFLLIEVKTCQPPRVCHQVPLLPSRPVKQSLWDHMQWCYNSTCVCTGSSDRLSYTTASGRLAARQCKIGC